jgi:serine/threonine-protein kinase
MAAYFPMLFSAEHRRLMLANAWNWLPGVISIADALAIALALRMARLRPATVTVLALAFEIISSYGIAAAEFIQSMGLNLPSHTWTGLSWVALWMLLFNVVVPTVPRYAVTAALASVTSVPACVLLSVTLFPPTATPNNFTFFFTFVFPYLLVVIMAYVGARVVYALGTEVSRARELGSYRLEERLGAGGMGEVWRASHRLLVRPAAIKLIHSPDQRDGAIREDMRRRFEREAQITAQLRSPHTVTLFDFGTTDDGSFYYVMELLDGVDTETVIKRFGPMPAERVVHILQQMCHSLSEADSCGLVHRDIKPANVFLCRYGEDHDFVKVLDFGIAKAVHDTSPDAHTAITMPNVVQGTPAFIAPEQALGGDDIDARADIYAAGCVAYWLLTGELVFTGGTPMKLLLAHAQTPPIPPSARTELPIPPDLDALIVECLAKDRDQRPGSARDLLHRLEAVRLERRWTEDRAREWWRTHLPSIPPAGQPPARL